jgi:hypothetical protein
MGLEEAVQESAVAKFCYHLTVLIRGDLPKYVADLESYFRKSVSEAEGVVANCGRGIEDLGRSIEYGTGEGASYFYWNGDRYGINEEVHKGNCHEVLEHLKQKRVQYAKQHKVQRINHGKVLSILLDGQPLTTLDLTNHWYKDHVVRIQYVQDTIRTRVYIAENADWWFRRNMYDGPDDYQNYDIDRSRAAAFAQHANNIEGVRAEVVREKDVDEKFPSLDDIITSSEIRRSGLRVEHPAFEFKQRGRSIRYSCRLAKAELEMLALFGDSCRRPEWLCYDSNSWSPGQGRKIIRNLLGILAVNSPDLGHKHPYYWLWIADRNERAVQKALKTGFFEQSIRIDSLPALAALHERTMALKQQYGTGFYPRFTTTEVAKLGSLKKAPTRRALDDLTGIIASVWEPCLVERGDITRTSSHGKWFIPSSRLNLIWNILDQKGYIKKCPRCRI